VQRRAWVSNCRVLFYSILPLLQFARGDTFGRGGSGCCRALWVAAVHCRCIAAVHGHQWAVLPCLGVASGTQGSKVERQLSSGDWPRPLCLRPGAQPFEPLIGRLRLHAFTNLQTISAPGRHRNPIGLARAAAAGPAPADWLGQVKQNADCHFLPPSCTSRRVAAGQSASLLWQTISTVGGNGPPLAPARTKGRPLPVGRDPFAYCP
jgi:hypothetical protein